MKELLAVGIGGFFGSITRYLIYMIFSRIIPDKLYFGTVCVNLLGCFLIGFFTNSFLKHYQQYGLMLITGFCGGFTTFSAYANDSLKMLRSGMILPFFIYTFINVILGIGACLWGFQINRN